MSAQASVGTRAAAGGELDEVAAVSRREVEGVGVTGATREGSGCGLQCETFSLGLAADSIAESFAKSVSFKSCSCWLPDAQRRKD